MINYHSRAFILYMYIPWGKALSVVPESRSFVKVKVKYQGQFSNKWTLRGHLCLTNTASFNIATVSILAPILS